MDSSNHQRFLEHLRLSEPARWAVAQWLLKRGYPVLLDPISFAPTRDEWETHADSGDLHVAVRVEVKQLSRDFTSRQDWPFGEKFIVCGRRAHDRAKPKPYGYVILNRAGTHAAFVLSATASTWRVESRTDSRYDNVTQEFYLAPLSAVRFSPLA